MRDDGVDIDLPSRADSIVDELLKNGGPDLVDAIHAVI
jgi:hypothetical protein